MLVSRRRRAMRVGVFGSMAGFRWGVEMELLKCGEGAWSRDGSPVGRG